MDCEYGCGKEASHQLKNGKWCCEITYQKCSRLKEIGSECKRKEKNPNYKKSPSIETREKMSKKRIGKKLGPFSEEHRKNISEARKGRTFSKRPNHSEFMKKNNPMDYIDMSGDKNPNWKGGISKLSYCSGWCYLSKEMREYEKECQNPNCNKQSERLTTHHIDYNKESCHPKNLIVLCHICNAKANGNRVWHENFYRGIKNSIQWNHTKNVSF